MEKLLVFLIQNQKSTDVKGDVAQGIRSKSSNYSDCDCDCYECAGGDTSDDD